MAIASVTTHRKGSIMGPICLSYGKFYILSISVIIFGDIAFFFLEILMIRDLLVSSLAWLKQEWGLEKFVCLLLFFFFVLFFCFF